jgi:hypothetical protein
MKRVKLTPLEKRVEKKFQEAKRRAEIRERYGVLTQQMFEDLLDKKLEEKLTPINRKLKTVDEKLDWLIGEYKKFDEEQKLLSNRVSEHTDNLELINTKLGIQV